jgi:hypothetical protein
VTTPRRREHPESVRVIRQRAGDVIRVPADEQSHD